MISCIARAGGTGEGADSLENETSWELGHFFPETGKYGPVLTVAVWCRKGIFFVKNTGLLYTTDATKLVP